MTPSLKRAAAAVLVLLTTFCAGTALAGKYDGTDHPYAGRVYKLLLNRLKYPADGNGVSATYRFRILVKPDGTVTDWEFESTRTISYALVSATERVFKGIKRLPRPPAGFNGVVGEIAYDGPNRNVWIGPVGMKIPKASRQGTARDATAAERARFRREWPAQCVREQKRVPGNAGILDSILRRYCSCLAGEIAAALKVNMSKSETDRQVERASQRCVDRMAAEAGK